MSGPVSCERVGDQLHQLKLESALSALDPVLEQGQKSEKLPVEILDELLGIELAPRFERRVKTNFKLSGLRRPKTLEEFDFDAQPQVPRDTVRELATLRFLHQGENVLFLDEVGDLPLEQPDATFRFEVVDNRYQAQKSIIFTPHPNAAVPMPS